MTRGRLTLRVRIWHAPLVTITTGLLLLGTMSAAGATPAPASRHPVVKPKPAPSVQHVQAVPTRFAKRPAGPPPFTATKTTWPKPSSATLRLQPATAAAAAHHAARAQAPSSPVWVQPAAPAAASAAATPGQVQVTVLDHQAATAAGVDGVVMTVSADRSGRAQVGLDYSGFAQAYGGNYGSRLRLATLPACALTTPTVPACQQQTPLVSANNAASSTVSALVSVPPATHALVLAASTAGGGEEGGSGGTYTATSLKASGSWTGGGGSGNFTYSYPLTVAPAPSALAPKLALSYDSSIADGQTAATQAQASWAGEGWSTGDAFIEQSFQSCSESPEGSAAPTKTYDQCYDGPIYTLALNGSSSALVWDAANKQFQTEDADGAVIVHWCTQRLDPTCTVDTKQNRANGSDAYAQDWWQITQRDGTSYSFGRNHLPGWASDKTATNSVATEPVYSAHTDDPCYRSAGMSISVCTMAYRWGLDYVVDTHGNAMAYYYGSDTNYYGQYNGASNVSYVRDMYLDHIDYGFTDGNAYGTVADKVLFHTGDRCVTSGCGPLSDKTKAQWPDVPYDLKCDKGATCKSYAPSYYSTVRLTGIEIQQYSAAASKYVPVDAYALTESMPASGDGTPATLWLSSIVHTGYQLAADGTTTSIALPPVTFDPIRLANRVDTATDGQPEFHKNRLWKITTETGSQIGVTYDLPNPCTAPVKINPATNTSSCYPVSWTPDGYTAPITDWFNKWAVTKVIQTDTTGGDPAVATSYAYKGGAAWHYDANELVKPKYRLYGQFRGYGDVITYLGDGANDRQAKTDTTYYRGMSKNNNSTPLNLPDSQGALHEDLDQLAGRELETSALLGDNVDHSTITSYWVSDPTATRKRTGLPDLTATWVVPVETFTRQAVTSGPSPTWRYTETDTSYVADPNDPSVGLPTYTYSHTVPANAAYDSCTATTYAPANPNNNLTGLVASTETDSVACGGYVAPVAGSKPSAPGSVNKLTAPLSVSRPKQVVAATRTYYGDPTFDPTFPQASPPATADVTMVQKAADYTGGAFTWQTQSQAKYDTAGRQTDGYDANGNHTHTDYTVDRVGLVTGATMTNPLGQSASSTTDPRRGARLTATDANSVVTTEQYDALGRIASVWLDSRATSAKANYTYTYYISNTGATAVVTNKLNESLDYIPSTLIYDGLLRQRQTQTLTPAGGRLVTDTKYDSRGWTSATATWWDPHTSPNVGTVKPGDVANTTVPIQHYYTYNSLGAVVIDQNENDNVEVSRTTTVYNGDRTTTFPPAGGTVTSTITDPLGRTVEHDSYLTPPTLTTPSDTFTGTFTVGGGVPRILSYGYDGHGQQARVTQGASDSGGPTWTDTYNLLGQVTEKSDPDAGKTTGMRYDGDGNLLQATDARGKTVSYTYDKLSRKTGKYAAAVDAQQPGATGNQLSASIYDNSNNVNGVTRPFGHLTTAISYSGGNAYTQQQTKFNVFGESQGTSVTIPAAEGALAGTYTVTHKYTANTGLPLTDTYNAQGGLPEETVGYNYLPGLDLPNGVGGLTGYAQSTSYDAFGNVLQSTIGAPPNEATITNVYDYNTGRLKNQRVAKAIASTQTLSEEAYHYDPAGNLLDQTSTRLGNNATSETQCFRYDGLDELVAAWTANDKCATTPSATDSSMVADNLGAGSAYWTTWTFNTLSDRDTQTTHAFSSGPSADTTTKYGYGAAGAQPHTLTSTTSSGGTPGATSYGYDLAGNMTTRNAREGAQTLSYNDADQLTSLNKATLVYDPDGNLLLQRDSDVVTLYLGTQQFALKNISNTVTGTRYYPLPGGAYAVRTGTGTTDVTYAVLDRHNTPSLYLNYTATTPTWRQYTPYGDSRGSAVTPPDNHGFLNKPNDTDTGLTILGARQYDPRLGRFITVDPIFEKADPIQIGGYGYADNNPVVNSDPTGTICRPDDEGGYIGFCNGRNHIGGGDGAPSKSKKSAGGGSAGNRGNVSETNTTSISQYWPHWSGQEPSMFVQGPPAPHGIAFYGPYEVGTTLDLLQNINAACSPISLGPSSAGCGTATDAVGGAASARSMSKVDLLKSRLQGNYYKNRTYFAKNETAIKWANAGDAEWVGRAGGALNIIGAVSTYAGEREQGASQVHAVAAAGLSYIGAVAGAEAGAEWGAIAGSFLGPEGTLVGGILGGAIGGFVGSGAGQVVVDKIASWF